MSSKRSRNKKQRTRKRRVQRAQGAGRSGVGVLRSRQPSEMDQMSVFIVEPELGLSESDLEGLSEMARRLPFEPAMLNVAVLQARLYPVIGSAAGHWDVAQQFYRSRPELLTRYERVLRDGERSIFSPQALMFLMRALIAEARNAPLRELTPEEFSLLQDAVLGAHSAIEWGLDHQVAGPGALLAYELQATAFFHRPPMLEDMARHRELLNLATKDCRLSASANQVPVEDWLGACGLTSAEQWALGSGLVAITHSPSETVLPRVPAAYLDDMLTKVGLSVTPLDLPMISASRGEFQAAFAKFGGGDATLAWETRPFKTTPFLRLDNGDLVLLSPAWLFSWVGEGFHYRALTQAQRSGIGDASSMYTRLAGEATELYAFDLAHAALDGSASQVHGEQPYGNKKNRKLTSDVAIVEDLDVVLFEVHARRVTAAVAVTGDVEDAALEVSRLLVKKIDQVASCVDALMSGNATLPGVDFSRVERVWPVVVAVGHVLQGKHLWEFLRAEMTTATAEVLSRQDVQPLQVMNMDDYEKLMGMIEAGARVADVLDLKVSGPYRELDFALWLRNDANVLFPDARLGVLAERWKTMSGEVADARAQTRDVVAEDHA